jgi:DNA-binding LacI/PurR family transcriptional regulator
LVQKRPRIGNFVSETIPPTQIAIVLPAWFHDKGHYQVTSTVVRGVSQALDQQKYSINILYYSMGKLWSDVGRFLVEKGISGIVLNPGKDVTLEDMQLLRNAGIKVVMISRAPHLKSLQSLFIGTDLGEALAQTLAKLVELGHRRIVYAGYLENPARKYHEEILEGFFNQISNSDVTQYDVIHIPNSFDRVDYTVLESIFAFTLRPTVVILPDEFSTYEMFRICAKKNINVPEDLSISALVDFTPHAYPISLSAPNSASQCTHVAKAAAKYLVKLLKGEKLFESEILFRASMQWKASVAKPSQ